MDQTLRQAGELLLGSIPTIIFMVLLYGLYNLLVHKPLAKVLAERRSKTEGAVEKARADIAAAEARTAEYEQKLREARLAVFKSQEARQQQALQARAAVAAEAHAKAHAQVEQARAAMEKDKIAAQENLQAESSKIAAEIIRTVLQPGSAPAAGVCDDA
jgi:F-type H+-transporting ATPase subunit b